MKDAKKILEEFLDLAEHRCTFDLKRGFHLEGYIFEVEDKNIVFVSSGFMASGEEQIIPISDIDLATLYFLSEAQNRYVHARWDDKNNKWALRPD